ncbi:MULTISPECIES: hypothetical protein [Myxococcus]|nr:MULTISPECIES: hypothetical protein [Myxococcus]NOJ55518.1 hypothetical protein [Myxococcus xanthus]QPM77894.1 hypothetical protein I5Q59_26905 [Myxococcus xanthus]QVW66961.1 hypothetical protein JTM82_32255 [Myxococcus xanthus DZ2]UEO06911.1 hypothetical protein K1515_10540 [Myxococcus xanthus DZ2]UYI12783.1 hypothetical protein N3T43_27490 [Myxococcus xanthus]
MPPHLTQANTSKSNVLLSNSARQDIQATPAISLRPRPGVWVTATRR